MHELPLLEGYEPDESQPEPQSLNLRDMLSLAWRTWPFLRPMVGHLIVLLALTGSGVVAGLAGFFVGTDLMTNKVLIGEKLQPLQATLLFLGDEYVTTNPKLLGKSDSADKSSFGTTSSPQVTNDDAISLESSEKMYPQQRRTVRNRLIAWGIVGGVFFSALGFLSWYYSTWIWQSVNQYLRVAMIKRAESLSLRYHDESRVGDAIFRVYQDSSMVVNVLQSGIIAPALSIYSILIALVTVLAFDPLIALFTVLGAVPFCFVLVISTHRIRRRSLANRLANSALTSHIQESFTAMKVIKANGSETQIHDRFDDESKRALDAAYYLRLDMVLLILAIAVLGGLLTLAAEYTFANWVTSERATFFGASVALLVNFVIWNIGSFTVATDRVESLVYNARGLLGIWMRIQDMFVALRRAFELLDAPLEVHEKSSPLNYPTPVTSVSWNNVSFAYQEESLVLSNLSLQADAGTITAIVGETGSGKSTMMSLLLRLFDPDSGEIRVNNIALPDLKLSELRANCAIALQKNVLFNDSVGNNIAFGTLLATSDDIKRAAQIAEADSFIQGLEEAYDTELGERGGKLSAGQRQRLSIARAIVRDTPILILDEPTASLDAETEQRVLANLADWGREKVILLITHRLSTIRNADKIAYLSNGQIVESGSHDELMQQSGSKYAEFVHAELNAPLHDQESS